MVYHSTRNQKAADRAGRLSAEQFSEQHPGWVSCLPSLRLLFARHCHWLISNTLLGPGEGFATAGRDLQQSTRRQIQDENLLLSADLARYLFDRSILKGNRWAPPDWLPRAPRPDGVHPDQFGVSDFYGRATHWLVGEVLRQQLSDDPANSTLLNLPAL